MHRVLLLLAFILFACLPGTASATPITYNLSNGTFVGGGTLSGSITIDNANGQLNGNFSPPLGKPHTRS